LPLNCFTTHTFTLYKQPPPKASAGEMEEKGQLMGVPIKLVMAPIIGPSAQNFLNLHLLHRNGLFNPFGRILRKHTLADRARVNFPILGSPDMATLCAFQLSELDFHHRCYHFKKNGGGYKAFVSPYFKGNIYKATFPLEIWRLKRWQ
jgi:hypothetical protein